jgi:phospholipid transport system substrate-binding protein
MKRWVTPAAALVVVLLLAPDGWAGAPTEQLRGFFTAAARILDRPATQGQPEQRLNTIRAMVGDIFDFREAARLSLGPAWDARTPAEREEFVRLFADLVERALIFGIAARIHVGDGVQVSYLGETVDGALASVWTTIASKSGLDLPFNYRMIERDDRWAVRDVVIDGVSLAANYRAQFARVIQTSSYRELVRQMQARASTGPTPPAIASVVMDGRTFAPLTPPRADVRRKESPEVASLELVRQVQTRGSSRSTPPLSPSVVTDGRALAALTAPPAEVMRNESAPAMSSPAPPEAPPARQSDDIAQDMRAPRRRLSEPISVVRPVVAPAAAAPSGDAHGAAQGEAGPAAPPREERVRPARIQLVSVARAASTPAPRTRSFWVQVGAFKNADAAGRLAAGLAGQESPGSSRWAVIVDMGPAETRLARVRIGPFSGRAEAASALRELQGRGYTPFIAEERN